MKKWSFWKAFKDCDMGIKQVFADLGKQAVLEDHIVRQLENYVCLLYQPDTNLTKLLSMCKGHGFFDVSK